MENKVTSGTFNYTGEVEISLIQGNTTIKKMKTKNEGRSGLFRFLASSLAGDFDKRGTPKYLMLGRKEGDTDTFSTGAIPFSAVSIKEIKEEGSSGAFKTEFKFLVPFSSLPSSLPKGEEINALFLYNSDITNKNYIASINLPEGKEISPDGKSNILIVWTMKISNAVENN